MEKVCAYIILAVGAGSSRVYTAAKTRFNDAKMVFINKNREANEK